jgi:hypothetical protein
MSDLSIRKDAADFYYRNAKGTSAEAYMTREAADNLGQMVELCREERLKIRERRNANRVVMERQADLLIDDASSRRMRARDYMALAIFLSAGFIGPFIDSLWR